MKWRDSNNQVTEYIFIKVRYCRAFFRITEFIFVESDACQHIRQVECFAYPQLLESAAHIAINRSSKNLPGIFSVHKDNIITGMDKPSCCHLFSGRLASKVFGIQANVVSGPFFAVNQSAYRVQPHNRPRLRKREWQINFSSLRSCPLIILANESIISIYAKLCVYLQEILNMLNYEFEKENDCRKD